MVDDRKLRTEKWGWEEKVGQRERAIWWGSNSLWRNTLTLFRISHQQNLEAGDYT